MRALSRVRDNGPEGAGGGSGVAGRASGIDANVS
jgi:hypothetical protein